MTIKITKNKTKDIAAVQSTTIGNGFLSMLTILFIGLKLVGLIDWSWWLVLLPFYGPVALTLVVIGLIVLVAILEPNKK